MCTPPYSMLRGCKHAYTVCMHSSTYGVRIRTLTPCCTVPRNPCEGSIVHITDRMHAPQRMCSSTWDAVVYLHPPCSYEQQRCAVYLHHSIYHTTVCMHSRERMCSSTEYVYTYACSMLLTVCMHSTAYGVATMRPQHPTTYVCMHSTAHVQQYGVWYAVLTVARTYACTAQHTVWIPTYSY